MGPKLSLTKQDSVPNSIGPSGRPHQYEEIDDVVLIKHEEMNSAITSPLGTCNSRTESPQTTESADLVSELKLRCKCLPDVIAESGAEATTPTTYSAKDNKRYHPYDEVNDEQLSCSQKIVNENKEKKKDELKEKMGKKKKKKNENEEGLTTELANAALKQQDACCSSITAQKERYHPYDDVSEEFLHSNNENKVAKEDKLKTKKDVKTKAGRKKQKALSPVIESISAEIASKLNISTGNIRAATRGHTYDEISEEQLVSNRENKKSDNHDNTKQGSESPQINTRYHPYDEITEEKLDSNRMFTKEKGDKLKKKKKEKPVKTIKIASDFSETEYLNVGIIQTSLVDSHVDEDCMKKQCEEGEDSMKDVYAVPQKKQLKGKQTKELNYIEVEFNTDAPKTAAKIEYEPTAYTNVVCKDGRIHIMES